MDDFNINDLLNDLSEGDKPKEILKKNNKEDSMNDNITKHFSKGKIVGCVILCFVFSLIMFLRISSYYTKNIRFPAQEEIIEEETGLYALNNFQQCVNSQKDIEGTENYLLAEIKYANSNPSRLAFIKSAVKTIKYEPDIINAKNIYGNDMIDKDTLEVVTIESPLVEGEEVTFYYIDYDNIVFDEDKLKNKIAEYELSPDDVKYSVDIVDMFCEYICEMKEIPIKSEKRAPKIKKQNQGYIVTSDEEIFIDKLLFSSNQFNNCKSRFVDAIGNIVFDGNFVESEEWVNWNKLSKIKKDATTEPLKYGKYDMLRDWCGAYYLTKERYLIDSNGNKVSDELKPELGDGSITNPASIGTSVLTYYIQKNNDGSVIKYPIRVKLVEFGVSENAINYFQSKSTQNRGFNLESELQYCYAKISITNLSNKKLVIKDNSALSDKNLNLSSKTGQIFGLIDSISLSQDEEGVIEVWNSSTELYKKYFIWGSDFDRQEEAVWFRVLAGDLEDTTFSKGVHIVNKDRSGIKDDNSQ